MSLRKREKQINQYHSSNKKRNQFLLPLTTTRAVDINKSKFIKRKELNKYGNQSRQILKRLVMQRLKSRLLITTNSMKKLLKTITMLRQLNKRNITITNMRRSKLKKNKRKSKMTQTKKTLMIFLEKQQMLAKIK